MLLAPLRAGWRLVPAIAEAGAFAAGLWCLARSGIAGAGFQPAFLQLLFGLLFLLPLAALFYRFDHLRTARLRQHAATAVLGTVSLACLYAGLQPLGMPVSLGLAAGSYAALTLAGARRRPEALASAAGLLILMLALTLKGLPAAAMALTLLPLAAGALRALAEAYALRHLAAEPAGARLFYGLILPLPLGALPALLSWQPVTPTAWPWVLASGLALALGHLLARLARRHSSGLPLPAPGPLALLWNLSLLPLLQAGAPPLDRLTLAGLVTIVLVTGIPLSSGRPAGKSPRT
ncbi:hypothetical protein [Radicibacter daui]|uniref:hypothetical protein n=1 Tax=Radicibacter daui TaxID=3064829 RepID=UPI0040470339